MISSDDSKDDDDEDYDDNDKDSDAASITDLFKLNR